MSLKVRRVSSRAVVVHAIAWGWVLSVALAPAIGCRPLGAKQMARVAKDWSLSVRAQQVIPLYPLREDLDVGDVYLVSLPVAQQQEQYKGSGFLALDDHWGRLQELDYKSSYFDGFWRDEFGGTPHARPPANPNAGRLQPTTDGSVPSIPLTASPAPRAQFVSYTFEVSRQGGLSLAIPVQGVPVGFNFLGAERATGTATLLDARTYGADSVQLERRLREWAEGADVAQGLRDATANGRPVFLRVITRVFLVNGVSVVLNRSDVTGAAGSAGANPPVAAVIDSTGKVNEDNKAVLDALSAAATSGKMGGAVRFTQASRLGVTLNETFDRPLVIGYHGFDVAVDADGHLGPRVPTFQVLERGRIPPRSLPVGELSAAQRRHVVQVHAMRHLPREPEGDVRALRVIERVGSRIRDDELRRVAARARQMLATERSAGDVEAVVEAFTRAADAYVSINGAQGRRYAMFSAIFEEEFETSDRP